NVSCYMWLPETQTSVETLQGTVDSTLGAREALEAVDVGAMLGVTAQRGAWSFLGDFFYLDLSLHERTPFGRLFSSVDTRTKLASLAGYGLYRVYGSDGWGIDAGAGLRLLSSDIEVTLQGVARDDRSTEARDNWTDPLLALRASAHFGDRWQTTVLADAGGLGIDSASDKTWQIVTVLTYRIAEGWSASGGYRHLHVEQKRGE